MSGLIGLDWGTSRLRAYRFDGHGGIVETRSRPWGILHLPDGGFEAALADITAGWPALPRIACGMVGSRNGWVEVPYVDLPAGPAKLCAAVRRLRLADGSFLHIVPGLRSIASPDVMRGEETQILGALALRPAVPEHSVWVLPGTHSKWALLDGDALTTFRTFMTGELYALLCHHSLLGLGTSEAVEAPDVFQRGVAAARDSGAQGALSRLFGTRALMLAGELTPAVVPEYLSGLLIGEEFRAALAGGRFSTSDVVQLIGEPALCRRYRVAAAGFGIEAAPPVDEAAAHGLWRIAARAGLLDEPAFAAMTGAGSC